MSTKADEQANTNFDEQDQTSIDELIDLINESVILESSQFGFEKARGKNE